MSVLRLLGGRLVQAALVALVVGTASFFLVEALPGDQAYRIAAGRYGEDHVSTLAAEAVRVELGLDRSLVARLGAWLFDLARLDLGRSMVTGETVFHELTLQLGATVGLSCAALLLSVLIGPPLGLLLAIRSGGWADGVVLTGATALRAIPMFVIGLALMLIFASWLGVLPAAGYSRVEDWILPTLTLGLTMAAVSCVVTRNSAIAVLQAPHVAYAATKGLGQAAIMRRHVLRNVAVPVTVLLGLQLVTLVEGVVVVETLFSWPGIGHALVHALVARDVPMVQGTALVMGLFFVALNATVDLLTLVIDPRASHRTDPVRRPAVVPSGATKGVTT